MNWRQMPHGAAGSGPRVTITAATNERRPLATAWQIAFRSAQIVPPKLAFSTLQPATTAPSEHANAAPTA
jgi:hypothetical protein